MMRSIIVLSLALLLVACKHEKEYSGNPIVEGWYADPEGVVFDDEYWDISYVVRYSFRSR